jgi:hypothetical protein
LNKVWKGREKNKIIGVEINEDEEFVGGFATK